MSKPETQSAVGSTRLLAHANRWQSKQLRVEKKMAAMRAAKERKRMDRGGIDEPPRMVRWFPLELGVRDKSTGEVAWVDLRSVRDAAKRLAIVQYLYQSAVRP